MLELKGEKPREKHTIVSTAEVEMDRPPPGTIKQGYLTKSPPLEKRGLKVRYHLVLLKESAVYSSDLEDYQRLRL